MKFNENLSSGSWVISCRRTDRHGEAGSPFQNYMNVPKNEPKTPLHRVTLNWDSAITAGVFQ